MPAEHEMRVFKLTDGNFYIATYVANNEKYLEVKDIVQISYEYISELHGETIYFYEHPQTNFFQNKQRLIKYNIIFEGSPTIKLRDEYVKYVKNKTTII